LDILILSPGGLRPWQGRLLLTVGAQLVGVYKVKEALNERAQAGGRRCPRPSERPKAEALSGGDREALAEALGKQARAARPSLGPPHLERRRPCLSAIREPNCHRKSVDTGARAAIPEGLPASWNAQIQLDYGTF